MLNFLVNEKKNFISSFPVLTNITHIFHLFCGIENNKQPHLVFIKFLKAKGKYTKYVFLCSKSYDYIFFCIILCSMSSLISIHSRKILANVIRRKGKEEMHKKFMIFAYTERIFEFWLSSLE